jgi:phosphate acetyltransferase
MKRALLLVPASYSSGLHALALGIEKFFEMNGVNTVIFKPIISEKEDSTSSNESININIAANLYSNGQSNLLMEQIIDNYQIAAKNTNIVIIQGLSIADDSYYSQQLNKKIAATINPEIIIVASYQYETKDTLLKNINMTKRFFSHHGKNNVIACILNKINSPSNPLHNTDPQQITRPLLTQTDISIPIIANVPWEQKLLQPLLKDVIKYIDGKIINKGNLDQARLSQISMCARSLDNFLPALKEGNFIITAGDRSDIILATCLAVLNGCKISGLLLTGGYVPNKELLDLCYKPLLNDLCIISTKYDSFTTTAMMHKMPMHIKQHDKSQQEFIGSYIANYISPKWLNSWAEKDIKVSLTPALFRQQLIHKAKSDLKTILLPEGTEPRVIEAAILCYSRKIARPILLGDIDEITIIANNLGYDLPPELEIIHPKSIIQDYISALVELRKHKGMDVNIAKEQLKDNIVLATTMLATGAADGMVAGTINTTANTIRPALQLIKKQKDISLVSSIFFMCLPNQVIIYGDCAINTDPTASELADIAIQSASSAEHFGIKAKVAMLSYATGSSGSGSEVDKVIAATNIVKKQCPNIIIDGPLQYDAATNSDVAIKKAANSPVAGSATVCIFPNLNAGNTTYKAVQRSTNALCIGPMLQGLSKPVNDLSRGATIEDIVFTIVITAIQAQKKQL